MEGHGEHNQRSLKMGKGIDTQRPCSASTPHTAHSSAPGNTAPNKSHISSLSSLGKNQEGEWGENDEETGEERDCSERKLAAFNLQQERTMTEATVQTQGTASSWLVTCYQWLPSHHRSNKHAAHRGEQCIPWGQASNDRGRFHTEVAQPLPFVVSSRHEQGQIQEAILQNGGSFYEGWAAPPGFQPIAVGIRFFMRQSKR